MLTFRKQSGDHGYATANLKHPEPVQKENKTSETSNKEESERKRAKRESHENIVVEIPEVLFNQEETKESESTAKADMKERPGRRGLTVCNEHSYGTKRDSSPELDQVLVRHESFR